MARLLVSSQRNGISLSEGNSASMTLGIVSPTMTQKANMPPNALQDISIRPQMHAVLHIQQPLCQRYCDQPRLSKAVLDRGLERVGAAKLRVYDDEADGPVDDDGQADEQDGAGDEAGVAESVGLADDAGASALRQPDSHLCAGQSHTMLLAMFIKALRIPLRGRALSRWFSGSNASEASVTLGASIPVSKGSRCTLSRPWPCASM
jgi:hypothetical protein